MPNPITQSLAVASKEFRSEFRTRYALNALGMFVVVTVAVILFAVGPEEIRSSITAALLWIALFFVAATGLARSFVAEEERGTALLLRTTIGSTPVFFGKLLFNVVAALITSEAVLLLYTVLLGLPESASFALLAVLVAMIAVGLAAAMTIISAIVARASGRATLTPVLAFPIVLPTIVLGVDVLRRSLDGRSSADMLDELLLIAAYIVLLVLVSFMLFDLLWKE